jgi:hypothetical protein
MERNIFDIAKKTIDTFIDTVNSFPPEKFNIIPFAGSWTAAQVTDHMFQAVSGLPQMLQSNVIATDRAPDEKCALIEKIFLDFSTKMKAPDFLLPADRQPSQSDMVHAWQDLKQQLLNVITDLDPAMTSTAFELPGMGQFTRHEWMWFTICHIKRHTHQLKNIHGIVVGGLPVNAAVSKN